MTKKLEKIEKGFSMSVGFEDERNKGVGDRRSRTEKGKKNVV